MREQTNRGNAGRPTHSHLWTVALCGLAGFALATPAAAKDITINPGGVVDFYANVSAVREVPAGNPLPGLHIDAKVKGRMTDIYISPIDFAVKYEIKVAKGDDVHIVGTQVATGDVDVVLAREITMGTYDRRAGFFRANMTVYLRNNDGPFWVDAPRAGSE